jgi:hypothetical protein
MGGNLRSSGQVSPSWCVRPSLSRSHCWATPAMLSMNGGVPATFSVLANMVANIADVRTVAPARSVFLKDFSDPFEPWLELPLKQAGLGSSKMPLHRGAKTLTSSRHLWLESQNGSIYVKNITKCLANGDLDDVSIRSVTTAPR